MECLQKRIPAKIIPCLFSRGRTARFCAKFEASSFGISFTCQCPSILGTKLLLSTWSDLQIHLNLAFFTTRMVLVLDSRWFQNAWMVRSHIVIEMIRIPTVSIHMNGFIDSWKGIDSFDKWDISLRCYNCKDLARIWGRQSEVCEVQFTRWWTPFLLQMFNSQHPGISESLVASDPPICQRLEPLDIVDMHLFTQASGSSFR